MKKKVISGLVLGTSVLGVCVASGVTSYAAETEVGIGFSTHTDPGEPGDLKLRWVPAELDFGSDNTVNKTAAVEFPERDEAAGSNKYVVVEDSRDHSGADLEWKVTAELSELVSTTVAANKLPGATLSFNTDLKDYSGTEDPATAGIGAVAGQTATMAANYILNIDTPIQVMKDNGDGSVTTSFEGNTAMQMKDIKLKVPANVAQKGNQYKGTITWTLADTI